MDRKPPAPVCKAFLVCREIAGRTLTLMGDNCYINRRFPNGLPMAIFARLTGGHGEYELELQLYDRAGNVVWRDGPEEKWLPTSPLDVLDVPWTIMPIFPGPGDYCLVLAANDEELAREPFYARHPEQMATA
jgi:hypothetical protein